MFDAAEKKSKESASGEPASKPLAREKSIPVNQSNAEPYIAMSRADVTDLCASWLGNQEVLFRRFEKILSAWYHQALQGQLEALKHSFENDTQGFAKTLDEIVKAANFTRVTEQDIATALVEESTFRLRLSVDFNDYEEVVFYARGEQFATETVPKWLGLSTRELTFTNLEHVLVYLRFKPASAFENPRDLPYIPGSSMLKLFENVPRADLEMLFPNTKVRMRLVDKLFIGVPAFVSGLVVFTTKVGGTLLLLSGLFAFWLGLRTQPVVLDQAALAGLLTGAGALGAYLWKQYSSFKNRKIRFMKTLTEHLYFKTLANDAGVLAYLIDRAEESETKEVLLAYSTLLARGRMTQAVLKSTIDAQFAGSIDFDIADAVMKLRDLSLIEEDGAQLAAYPLETALATVDARWDALFDETA